MIGLIAIIVIGVLLLLAGAVFAWVRRIARRRGKSDRSSFWWGIGAVLVLSLPITWDAIPTWIAFEYYKKEAGITIFKTLEQWKVENPGVAETLEPYGFKDRRADFKKLTANKSRNPLNDRFAYDATSKEKLFLSVYANRYEVIDLKTGDVLVSYVEVGSGNSGGLASGGAGWWAFWLTHKPTQSGVGSWSEYVQSAKNIGMKK